MCLGASVLQTSSHKPDLEAQGILKRIGLKIQPYVGKKAFINYDMLCQQLGRIGENDFSNGHVSK